MSEGRNGTARWLLAVVAFLIVYGSLFPFRFEDVGASGPVDLLRRLTWARTTPSDIAANVLLYLPLGVCLAWLLAARLGSLLAIAVACSAGAVLSTVIEVAQLYETRRVSSLTDIACNTLGALAGALLARSAVELEAWLADDGELLHWQERFLAHRERLREQGVQAMFRSLLFELEVPSRLLAQPDGDGQPADGPLRRTRQRPR